MTTDSRVAAPRVAARSTLAGRGNECARRASTRERDARGMAAADGVAGTRAMARALTRAVTRGDARARRAGTRARAEADGADIDSRERSRSRARRRDVVLGGSLATVMTSSGGGSGIEARAEETTPGMREVMEMRGESFGDVELAPYVDLENGYALLAPEDWVKDLPNGIAEVEFHPRSEYGGRRFKVQVRPYGRTTSLRLDELDEPEYASPLAYAEDVARKYAPLEGEGKTNRGQAVSNVLSSRMSDDGRYYFFEYATDSMLPLHFWGVIALGPGPVGSARKLGRKDIIALTSQMPEDKGPEAAALLEHIVSTFKILDV